VGDASFEADLHIHTVRSRDAHIEPGELVAAARRLGLFAIAVTDHNTVAAVREVVSLAHGQDLLVVPGVEVSSRDGHVLALGVSEDVPAGLGADETMRKIEDLGGLAVAAHPGRVYTGLHDDVIRESGFRAVEVANGHSSKRLNRRATRLAARLGTATTGGSDAHFLSEVGNCRTAFLTAPSDVEGVLEAIRAREVKAVGEGMGPGAQVGLQAKMASRWVVRGGRRL
jgi:predicted metal-dependent phosphoesterase TrpH